MAAPTAQEQFILELINRARLDPAAEAARLGIALNQGLAAGTITAAQKQPLAFNPLLNDAADTHSNWMLNADVFSHTGAGGSSPGDRMRAAGYKFAGSWTYGENIHWSGTTGTLNFNAAAQQAHDALFRSAGHRLNILNGNFREIGIGANTGQFQSNGVNYNAFMTTENFAASGTDRFITGVVYTDSNANGFYSIGEGRGGVSVSGTATWGSGGYSIAQSVSGPVTLNFSGGGLRAAAQATVTLGAENVKVDLVNGNTVHSSASTTIAQGAVNLTLLGLANIDGTGSAAANTIIGNKGDNRLSGLDGNDTLKGGDGNDVLIGGRGADKMTGGNGADIFVFTSIDDSAPGARDTITDFLKGTDKLDFSAIDANTMQAGDQAFVLDTDGVLATGEIRLTAQRGGLLVELNNDADAAVEMAIFLTGVTSLAWSDFVL